MGIDSMKISFTLLPEQSTKTVEVTEGTPIIEVLRKLQLHPDALIILRNNTPIPIDEKLVKDEDLSVLKVASGG
jgi:sulfur carrier protein ThiS